MTTIAFIGTGTMGAPMARNLVAAGHRVQAFSRTPSRVEALIPYGVIAAFSLVEAMSGAEVAITVLPDTPDVESVLVGRGGLLSLALPDFLVIDMSTIRPDVAKQIAETGRTRGVSVLDAPVSGGEQGAVAGTLSVMVGGEAAAVERALPVLTVVGSTIVHVGPSGAGQTVKAANQLMVAGNMQALAEAIVFLEAHGVDVETAIRVLEGGLAGSAVMTNKARPMIDREFSPTFRSDLFLKDLRIVQDAARHAGLVAPLAAVLEQLLTSLVLQGGAGLDHSALISTVERLSGRPANHETGARS